MARISDTTHVTEREERRPELGIAGAAERQRHYDRRDGDEDAGLGVGHDAQGDVMLLGSAQERVDALAGPHFAEVGGLFLDLPDGFFTYEVEEPTEGARFYRVIQN
jgi:hypothetical protein